MLESNNPKQKFLNGVLFKLLIYRWDSGEWMWYFWGSRNLTFMVYSYTRCFLGVSSQALWAMLEVKTILSTWIPKSTWWMQFLVVLHSIYITALLFWNFSTWKGSLRKENYNIKHQLKMTTSTSKEIQKSSRLEAAHSQTGNQHRKVSTQLIQPT